MSELLQSESLEAKHPDADQLSAFVEHALPEHEHRETLVHLADCAACRNIVAHSLPPFEEIPMAEPAKVSPPRFAGWFSGWTLVSARIWVAAPALAALVALVVYLQTRTHHRSLVTPPAQVAKMRAPSKDAALPIPSTPKSVSAQQAPQSAPTRDTPRASNPRDNATADSVAARPLEGRGIGVAKSTSKYPQEVPSASQGTTGSRSSAGGLASRQGLGSTRSANSDGAALGLLNRPSHAAHSIHALPAPERQSEPLDEADTVAVVYGTVAPSSLAAPESFDASASAHAPSSSGRLQASGVTSDGISSFRKSTVVPNQAALPSGLPLISIAANLAQRIAIDTGNQLFFSADAGQHWRSVASPWRARAILVSAVASARLKNVAPQAQALAFAVPERYTPGETAVVETDMRGDSLSGRITDPSGATIPHATVVVTDSRIGVIRTVETDSAGSYLVANFVPGLYRISARASGFQNQSVLVDLSSASQAVRNITLNGGQVSQTGTVEASNAPLEIERQISGSAMKSHRPLSSSPASQLSQQALFAVTTDTGERWISPDGRNWKPE